ncbi:MAG: CBS domain-containing protein [Saprospiraceae bacterium]|nr:CBS domain-containing protein [Saprospiraceae bacterium]
MEVQLVKDSMNKNVGVVYVDDTIDLAISKMEQNAFSHLMVEDANTICGIISKTDILARLKSITYSTGGRSYNEKLLKGMKVWECMTPSPDCVNINDTLEVAAAAMLETNHNVLPVLDDSGKICGIISTLDLVRSVYKPK